MEIKSLAAFQKLLAEIQARQSTLTGELAELDVQLKAKLAGFDTAILEGHDPEKLQAEVDALQKKIDLKRRETSALEAATSGKAKTGPLHQAAKAVWQEGATLITETIRAQWDKKLAELDALSEKYLEIVGELGEIKREADTVSSKISYGLDPVGPPAGVPSLSTEVYEEKFVGPIFPDNNEIKRAYQGKRS